MNTLIEKYNIPCPRYTSYPTVPNWKQIPMGEEEWLQSVRQNLAHFKQNKTAVYIHLPFCESMCTFCGCHKRITKNHGVEGGYVDALLNEWQIYSDQFLLHIDDLHLGGGTPTFFSMEQLDRLLGKILGKQKGQLDDCNFSFEGHPNHTKKEHLEGLYKWGFRRVSFGIQDYDQTVQKAIHRFQSFEQVQQVHELAKKIGYKSISHDLVYGLPKQNWQGFKRSIELTLQLRPDRVSLYSYAHVPWIKGNGQRGFDESDLPDNHEKRALYEGARELFLDAGYIEIGMDHFALPHDDLAIALKNKSLHRNFMGYTVQENNLLIGLGASSISDSYFAFAQNEKKVETYQELALQGQVPIVKGHLLSAQDQQIRRNILDLMCQYESELPSDPELTANIRKQLEELKEDGLILIEDGKVRVLEEGEAFVRNVCRAFDQYIDHSQIDNQTYSKAI
ncbi:MAG: oxygen-independent coproporphyrinogen III oxidase [Bacteroidetes bacterium]|nr:MAG: oxygen-independent coproporphyrinogen III oxidase [Bacteroidota bacterium]